jgi:hypothetical protein
MKTVIRAALTLVAGIMAGCVHLTMPASPGFARAADASVSGTVTDATTGSIVADAPLSIIGYQNNAQTTTSTTRTGSDGAFSFPGLRAGGGWTYDVVISYHNGQYRSAVAGLAAGENRHVALSVYQPTSSAEGVVQDSWIVWIDVLDSLAAIEQDVVLTNTAKTSYIGEATRQGVREVMRLPVADDAGNLQYLGFLSEATGQRSGSSFVSSAPVVPGQSQAALRYETSSLGELSFPVLFPTTNFTMMVPPGVAAESAQLVPDGQSQDRGTTYDVLVANELKPGDVVTVTLRRVTGPADSAGGWNGTAVGVVAVAAAVLVLVIVINRRRQRPALAAAAAVRARSSAASVPCGPGPKRSGANQPGVDRAGQERPSLEQPDVELLLDHVALLDLAHERGALPDAAEYRKRRAAATERLIKAWGGPADPDATQAGEPKADRARTTGRERS